MSARATLSGLVAFGLAMSLPLPVAGREGGLGEDGDGVQIPGILRL